MLRAMVLGACFFTAAAVTAWLVDGRLPFPAVPEISPRFRYFAGRKDEFDTVFIGSSRIRHQVIPQQFDAGTAAEGVKTHSFNLGYSGMWPPESYYYLRQVLALHPRQLRWVVIELMDYRFGQAEGQATTARSVYWHDAKDTAMAWRLIAESALPAGEKLTLFAEHARLFLQRMAHLGRGAEWLQQRYFPAKKKGDTGWIKRRGFDPEENGEWSESARADYEQKIRAFQQTAGDGRVRPGFAAAVQEIAGELRRAGAEPVFVLPPTVRVEEHLSTGLLAGITVWKFDDPVQYPRLYLPALHYDPGHLNEAGAREFTDLLAQRLAELAQKHGGP
ncbi:MAG: hypothetical protein ABJF10_17875 [Chthoniobacter sp.]|uniref:hypothetical protein n=1 Tax=Chthoniobacter sp. TaxID=2510640 RepID=UPI0032A65DED